MTAVQDTQQTLAARAAEFDLAFTLPLCGRPARGGRRLGGTEGREESCAQDELERAAKRFHGVICQSVRVGRVGARCGEFELETALE